MSSFTKDAITDSFLRLLEEKRLDKITVKDIVLDCGVSRKTFYYYFDDIYDLLEKCLADKAQEASSRVSDFESFEKELLNLSDFVMKHKKAMYHIYYSVSRDKLEDYLYNGSIDTLTQIIKKKSVGTGCNDEDIEIVSILCTNAFTSSVLRWIKDGMRSDLGHILKRITLMFDDALKAALIKAGQNK